MKMGVKLYLAEFPARIGVGGQGVARDQGSSTLCVYASEVIPCFLSVWYTQAQLAYKIRDRFAFKQVG
jgi:hypothetical protein